MSSKKIENVFITQSAENREKIYKIAYEIFKDSINEIEKTDKKINYYLIILNIFLIIFINFIIKYISFSILDNRININLVQLFLILNIIILFVLFFTSLFLCLVSLKLRLIHIHPTLKEFDEILFRYTDKKFWHTMFGYYFQISYKNNEIMKDKKNYVKIIEHLLFVIVIFIILLIILILINNFSIYDSINILNFINIKIRS